MQMFSVCRASQHLLLSNYVFATFGLLRLFQIKAQGVSVVAQHSFSETEKCASVQRFIYFNMTSSEEHEPTEQTKIGIESQNMLVTSILISIEADLLKDFFNFNVN